MEIMGGLALNNRALDRYFRYLRELDNNSKKDLIIRLTESLDVSSTSSKDISKLFGSWEDSRSSDVIIKEIKESRIESDDIEKM